jgi:KDO2-lipid IV(A) lauroyltransferase
MLEVGALWLWNRERVLGLVKQVHGEEQVTAAMEAGHGVILALPHLGAWELVSLYCSTKYPLTSLYKPPKLAQLDGLIRNARERLGARLVPTSASGVRALYSALNNNETIIILPDQDPGNVGNVSAPFFGIQTNTMTLLSRLAQKSGATVIFCQAERLAGGNGFNLYFETAPKEVADHDAAMAATAMNREIERCVSHCPAQYQWNYKRFKKRPTGETTLYPF